jgi:hypothetical protein
MASRKVVCPKCNTVQEVPLNAESVHCIKCHERVMILNPLSPEEIEGEGIEGGEPGIEFKYPGF